MGILRMATFMNGVGERKYVPLSQLAGQFPNIGRLPRSLLVLLESALRGHLQGKLGHEHVARIAGWLPDAPRTEEVSFFVNRILVPDSTGIPLLVDLAAMRSAAAGKGRDVEAIEPQIQIDMVIDHSVQIDAFGRPDALSLNTALEFSRNAERFRFIKWADAAFQRLSVTPPGNGICHQINLEQIARVVWETEGVVHPDLLLGCDSHTPMVNGLGVLGWGVGGIEAEAAMLGQPVTILLPDVVGVHLTGQLPVGVTTTDLVLTVTEQLRKARVVGKFVEFFGIGAAALSVPERATLSNMAPEYGATVGYFPVDDRTLEYLADTGRGRALIDSVREYFTAQGMFGTPANGDVDFSQVIEVDLGAVEPSIAGPRRPQDRIALRDAKLKIVEALSTPTTDGGYGRAHAERIEGRFNDGDVVLAAITSCTNTSNPQVMVAAGLLARNAVAAGMSVNPRIKTSFSPGSRAVAEYMKRLGLLEPLAKLGFNVAAFGCGTCLGNSGPLDPTIEGDLVERGVVAAAILSGNRNFEARVHPSIRANFLASPPLVIAYAIAGSMGIDFLSDPLPGGKMLADIWPDPEEVSTLAAQAAMLGRTATAGAEEQWNAIKAATSKVYDWPESTYIKEPPFFDEGSTIDLLAPIHGARPLLVLGDSVTTDHISPAGSIKPVSDAGKWLLEHDVIQSNFNTFASRRGNHEIMIRGTFGNARLRNRIVPDKEGAVTRHFPSGEKMSVFEAARRYSAEGVPLVVVAGREYGTGSSRDWAAKGTNLLGIRVILAESFERIHRGNLVGLGVLPLEFAGGVTADRLDFTGAEKIDITLSSDLAPGGFVPVRIYRDGGRTESFMTTLRVDTDTEMEYLRHGGIMRFVLAQSLI